MKESIGGCVCGSWDVVASEVNAYWAMIAGIICLGSGPGIELEMLGVNNGGGRLNITLRVCGIVQKTWTCMDMDFDVGEVAVKGIVLKGCVINTMG